MRAKRSLRKCEMLEMIMIVRRMNQRLKITLVLMKNQRILLLYQRQMKIISGIKILWRKFYICV
jgi:hypothetical protein